MIADVIWHKNPQTNSSNKFKHDYMITSANFQKVVRLTVSLTKNTHKTLSPDCFSTNTLQLKLKHCINAMRIYKMNYIEDTKKLDFGQ